MKIEKLLIKHPNMLGKLYVMSKSLKIKPITRKLDSLLKKQRKKGLILVKNVSGKTIEKDKIISLNEGRAI